MLIENRGSARTWRTDWRPCSISSFWIRPRSGCAAVSKSGPGWRTCGTAEEWRKPAEVARELGMKVGAVFQAKHSVITQLRREIEILQGPP